MNRPRTIIIDETLWTRARRVAKHAQGGLYEGNMSRLIRRALLELVEREEREIEARRVR